MLQGAPGGIAGTGHPMICTNPTKGAAHKQKENVVLVTVLVSVPLAAEALVVLVLNMLVHVVQLVHAPSHLMVCIAHTVTHKRMGE